MYIHIAMGCKFSIAIQPIRSPVQTIKKIPNELQIKYNRLVKNINVVRSNKNTTSAHATTAAAKPPPGNIRRESKTCK